MTRLTSLIPLPRLLFAAACVTLIVGIARAQTVDIADTPLRSVGRAKPNIMLLLDNSTSMAWSYTGDDVYWLQNRIGYRSHLCNAQYYNPEVRYQLPPMSGSTNASTSFTRAPTNGFANSGFVDLSRNFAAWRESDCDSCSTERNGHSNQAGQAYYYEFIGNNDDRAQLGSSRERESSADLCWVSTPSSGNAGKNWKRINVDGVSGPVANPDERENFAIWYSFYRTRLLAMKSAISIAFESLDEQFRVGFSTIHERGTTDNASFLTIGDFTAPQRQRFISILQATETRYGTPLRGALSKAGRIYAGRIGTDPVQYSCQENYAIVASDGAWSSDGENSGFGPYNERGSRVGNADGNLPRPKYDGNGTSDTLADVAAYFRHTDLRPVGSCGGNKRDVCTDNVPGTDGKPTFQHMKTYAIALGVTGTLPYDPDYRTAPTGKFAEIVNGTRNWPRPSDDDAERVDDFWHAAVNGDGLYFNTQNIVQLQQALRGSLEAIVTETGAESPVTFDSTAMQASRHAYAASFRSSAWDGDLVANLIDVATGGLGPRLWSAADKLNKRVAAGDDRKIWLYDENSPNRLKAFKASALSADEKMVLANACDDPLPLAQCARLNAAQRALLDRNMVNWLRGQPQPAEVFRNRSNVLGDIVNSTPLHVGRPVAMLTEAGHHGFATSHANRTEMVYVGANDGMLHAFVADTGEEAWAYIPPAVLPRVARLADLFYPSRHQYTVDGAVVSADICIVRSGCTADKWRTVLVGGFNAGGVGFYALDITEPDNPKALWNFNQEPTLGLSFGNPLVIRLPDGTWSVVVTSGYNNADGGSYLYVLDAWTGRLLKTITTGVGNADQPGGLARIARGIDGSGTTVYGGDLRGNLWRFNVDPAVAANASVTRVATFRDGNGFDSPPQPVTAAPLVVRAWVGDQLRNLIIVGTGRYLGESDKEDVALQSLYVLKESLADGPIDNPRASMAARQLVEVNGDRSIQEDGPVDWTSQLGWYVDLAVAQMPQGERINIDPQVNGTLLTFAGNIPSSNACERGSAWFYAVDLRTGLARAPTLGVAITPIRVGLLVGFAPRPTSRFMSVLLVTDSGAQTTLGNWNIQSATPKRVSWRELAD